MVLLWNPDVAPESRLGRAQALLFVASIYGPLRSGLPAGAARRRLHTTSVGSAHHIKGSGKAGGAVGRGQFGPISPLFGPNLALQRPTAAVD